MIGRQTIFSQADIKILIPQKHMMKKHIEDIKMEIGTNHKIEKEQARQAIFEDGGKKKFHTLQNTENIFPNQMPSNQKKRAQGEQDSTLLRGVASKSQKLRTFYNDPQIKQSSFSINQTNVTEIDITTKQRPLNYLSSKNIKRTLNPNNEILPNRSLANSFLSYPYPYSKQNQNRQDQGKTEQYESLSQSFAHEPRKENQFLSYPSYSTNEKQFHKNNQTDHHEKIFNQAPINKFKHIHMNKVGVPTKGALFYIQ